MSANKLPSLKEERTHGSASFRCGCYVTNPADPSLQVQSHWHEEIEMIHIQKGHFLLEINLERYTADSDCLFFVQSGELHRIICEEPCTESAVVFSPYLLTFVTNDAAQSEVISPLSGSKLLLPRMLTPEHPAYAEIIGEYRKLTSCYSNGTLACQLPVSDQLFVKGALLNILGILSAHNLFRTEGTTHHESIEAVKTVLSYIHSHYMEKIFIKDLADLLSLNEQYFCRFFKKAVGQSPVSYINSYRIRRALSLLKETKLPVTEVCLECGFNNFGNFLREFRRETGTTPLQYRINYSRDNP